MLASERHRLFTQWLGEHKGLMFKVVRAYADCPEDQDDLFQEILLQVWSSIPAFQGKAKVSTGIYRVALNTALVWKRGQKRKRKKHRSVTMDLDEASATRQCSSDSLTQKQVVKQLYEAIRRLPKIDSSLVFMYMDGLGYDEMAEVLGISKSNVGVKLNRAKKQLAQLLKGLIDEV